MFKKVDAKDLKNKNLYKVLHDNISFAGSIPFVYRVGKVTESENFDIAKEGFDKINGFCFSDETNMLRFILRGNTIYDVVIPDDAKVYKYTTPNVNTPCYITNKLILENPRKITDRICTELYKKSNLPRTSYFQILPYLLHNDFKETAQIIMDEKVKGHEQECAEEIAKFSKK